MIVDARQDQENSSYSYGDGGGGIRSQWLQDIARFAGTSLGRLQYRSCRGSEGWLQGPELDRRESRWVVEI